MMDNDLDHKNDEEKQTTKTENVLFGIAQHQGEVNQRMGDIA